MLVISHFRVPTETKSDSVRTETPFLTPSNRPVISDPFPPWPLAQKELTFYAAEMLNPDPRSLSRAHPPGTRVMHGFGFFGVFWKGGNKAERKISREHKGSCFRTCCIPGFFPCGSDLRKSQLHLAPTQACKPGGRHFFSFSLLILVEPTHFSTTLSANNSLLPQPPIMQTGRHPYKSNRGTPLSHEKKKQKLHCPLGHG